LSLHADLFLTFHGEPTPEYEDKDVLGAYINCWIDANNINKAEAVARLEIEKLNWQILQREEGYEILINDYRENADGLQYYEQALIDWQVYVIHTYSSEDSQ
jgi:hypothetical protein